MKKKDVENRQNNDLDRKEELKKIGEKLKRIRKEKGYTSADKFAYEHDISRSQYAKYEAGSEDFRVSSLLKVLRKLGVSPSDFFSDEN